VRKAKEGLFAAAEKEPESKLSQAEEAKRKLANLGVVDKKAAYGVKSKSGSQHAKAPSPSDGQPETRGRSTQSAQ